MSTIWQTAGATLSLKNAIAQFGVTEHQLIEAKLPCRWSSCFGNSFPIFVRSDVEALARTLQGPAYEVKEARQALRAVNSELSTLEQKRASLAAQKEALEAKLASLGATAEEPPKEEGGAQARQRRRQGQGGGGGAGCQEEAQQQRRRLG